MNSGLKIALQYIVSLGLAIVLIYFALKGQDLSKTMDTIRKANPLYIILSTIFLTISHISRAKRWKILYKPLNYNPTLKSSFLALMSGYFINQLIPRLGEVTRCGVLQKIEKIPLQISFGTVIAERMMDLIMLIILFVFTFYIEFDRLSGFFLTFFQEKFKSVNDLSVYFYALVAILIFSVITLLFVYNRFKEKIHANKFFSKILSLVKNIIEGVISIIKIEARGEFLFHTLLIWGMYYCASYIVVFSLPTTSNLPLVAGFSMLLMGSLAMTAPVQGGIGAFHIMIAAVLVLYGINEEDGKNFAVLVHSSQYLFTLIFGGICFLITFYIKKKEETPTDEYSAENS